MGHVTSVAPSPASAAAEVDVSVLIPVYENAGTLDELLDRLLTTLEPLHITFELVCVDDGSRDDSLAILERRAAADGRIRPFALARNFGSQAASCAACDQARGRRIVHIDADLENYPEDIPRLLAELDRGYDFACGYREDRQGAWLTRGLPSQLMNAYVRRHTGSDLRDVGCGLRALDARLVRDLAAEGEARRLMTPVLLRRARNVIQVPVRYRPKRGRGGHSFVSLLGIAVDYYMLTTRRPFLITGLVSGAALVCGVLTLVAGVGLPAVVITCAAFLGGLLSLLGEYAQRLYVLAQRMPFYELRDEGERDGDPPGDSA